MVPKLLDIIEPVKELMGYNEVSNKEDTADLLRTLHKMLINEYQPYELVRLRMMSIVPTGEGGLAGRPGYIWVHWPEAEAMLGPEPAESEEKDMDAADHQRVILDVERVNDEVNIRGECSICLEPFPPKRTVKVIGCGHMYCQNCIDSMWKHAHASDWFAQCAATP